MHFAFSWALLLLLLPLLLFVFARGEQGKLQIRLARLGMFKTIQPMLTFFSPQRRLLRRVFGCLAVFFAVLALSGPQLGSKTDIRPRLGLDVVFAIDVSKSMRAQDVRPDRLQRAQFEIASFLEQIGENRVALVAFAGTSFVQCPLTTDIEAVKTFLQALSPELMPQGGTALSDGIETSIRLFEAQALAQSDAESATGRILVLVTDGEDHQGAIDEAAGALKKAHVSTVVIGLGSALGEPIPLKDEQGQMAGYLKDKKGQTVMTRLNGPMLQSIAEKSDGKYIDGLTEPDLGLSYVESLVGQLEKQELQARVQTFYVDRFFWPLLLAFLFWLLSTGLSPGGRSQHTTALFTFLMFLCASSSSMAQGANDKKSLFLRPEPQIEAGINALKRQDFESALKYFEEASGHTRPHRAIKAYNRGFVLLQQGALKAQAAAQQQQQQQGPGQPQPVPAAGENEANTAAFTGAEQAFQNAFGLSNIPQIRSEAALGLGNARLFQQDLEGAIEGYRDAIMAQPNNERARKNLLRALQMQQEQEQEKQEQEQEQEQNQDSEGEEGDQEKQQQNEQQQQEGEDEDEDEKKDKKKEQSQDDKEKNESEKKKEKKQSQEEKKKEEPQQQKSGVRLLDALREQEKPLAPFQMRMTAPKDLPEKDW